MIDRSNEGLIYKNNNKKNSLRKDNVISFDSISEKQEESSDSSNKNSKLLKSRAALKSTKNENLIKEGLNSINAPIPFKKIQPTTKNSFSYKKRKSMKLNNKEDDKDKKYFRKNSKKKFMAPKRTSFQKENLESLYKLKNLEGQQRHSSKNFAIENQLGPVLKAKKSLNITLNINKGKGIYSMFNKKNSFIGQTMLKNKNTNISDSEYLDKKYFSAKKIRNTVLRKNKLNLKEQRSMNVTTLFERLRESSLFEKSEALLFKIKICYGFLAVFSFLSILLETIDVFVFNKKTVEFLEVNYNINVLNETNINNYYFIEERKITSRENTIRMFNLIFSALCFFVHLIIHFIKINFDKESKKKKKRYYYNYTRRRKTRLDLKDQKNKDKRNNTNESHIKLIVNKDLMNANYATKDEMIKLTANCIISMIFYPPWLNKVFIGIHFKSLYVCSLNNIFLMFTFLKLINIYYAFYYLSPFNNLLYKTICSSNMVKMNFKFMFRFLLNTYPIIFILTNFLIIGIVICILLYNIEFFSINIYSGTLNNQGKNDLKNFYNEIFLFCFYIIKTISGSIRPETGFGCFILIIGGAIGLIIISYFIFFINQFFEFKPEEQQAYSKLIKLLNPINDEHKSSNVLQVFFLMKKMYIDFRNIEDEYRIKKDMQFKTFINKNLGIRKSNFNFATNESNYSDQNLEGNYEYKEKKKFIKYILTRFILKIKLLNESKNFKNKLLIARNYSLSFNDVLKTLGDKINGNITQLNNKLELLIQNDEKYRSFMKFQDHSVKKLKKILGYQEYLINYLIEKNNETTMEYFDENKQIRINFSGKFLNAQNSGVRRMRSSFNGQFLNFTKKSGRKKSADEQQSKASKDKRSDKDVLSSPKKTGFKRLKSSMFRNKPEINNTDVTRAKTNPVKRFNNKNKISKSLDENKLKIYQKVKSKNLLDFEEREKVRKKARSLTGKKKEEISKRRKKIEK